MSKDKDRRIVNLRLVFSCFVGIMLGILSSSFLLQNKMSVVAFIFVILLAIAIVVFGVIYSIRLKKSCDGTKFRVSIPRLMKWSAIGFGVTFLIGAIVSISPMLKIINLTKYEDEVVVSGVVCDYVDREDTYTQFLLKDCKVITDDSVDKISMKIVVNTSIYADIKLGDSITFEGELSAYEIDSSYGFSKLVQGIGYSTYASTDKIAKTSGDMELKDTIHSNVKSILDDNLNGDNSEICFAILFGQKYGLSDSISNMFSYAGISHILAVSGLHIGVLVSLIWFAIKKLKINDYIKLSIFAIVLIFYSYLCSFSPSVCRASIMAFVLALCKIHCWEYDITNSLSIAGCVILLFNPLSLFSVSFQLSFMCVFAIITFAPFLKKCLSKIKCPEVLSQALAISIAVNIVILPVCMNIFYKVSLLGIIANIFVLPIFSIAYILLFVVVLISLIIRPLGVLLLLPNLFLHLIKTIAYYFSLIPFGVFRVFNVSYWLIVLVALITLTIHFLMVKHWWKYLYVSVLSIICIAIMVVGCLPKVYDSDTLIINSQYNSNIVIYTIDNENVLVGSNISVSKLEQLTRSLRIKDIDKIVAYDLQLNKIDELYEICNNYKVKSVIVPNDYDYSAIASKLQNVEIINDSYIVGNLTIELIYDSDDLIGVQLNKFTKEFLLPVINNSKSENNNLYSNYSDVDYIITDDCEFWQDIDACVIDLINTDTMFL